MSKTIKQKRKCKCGVRNHPRNAHGACIYSKRKRDRAIQERRVQACIGGVRFSKVFPTPEEAQAARSKLLHYRDEQHIPGRK